jgi:hypothetical protein
MMRTSTSDSNHSINFNRMLEECQVVLSLQETDLELQEVKRVEEQASGGTSVWPTFLRRAGPIGGARRASRVCGRVKDERAA